MESNATIYKTRLALTIYYNCSIFITIKERYYIFYSKNNIEREEFTLKEKLIKEILEKIKNGDVKKVHFLTDVIIATTTEEIFFTNFSFEKNICKSEVIDSSDKNNVSINKHEVNREKGLQVLENALKNSDFSYYKIIKDILIITH